MKLSEKQKEILDRIKSGEKCLWECIGQSWFMTKDYKNCSKQVLALVRKGFLKIIGFGISREIRIIEKEVQEK